MKVRVIPIVIVVLGTIPKGFVKGLEESEIGTREETIQTTASLRSAELMKRVKETWGDFLSLRIQWKPIH